MLEEAGVHAADLVFKLHLFRFTVHTGSHFGGQFALHYFPPGADSGIRGLDPLRDHHLVLESSSLADGRRADRSLLLVLAEDAAMCSLL